MILLSPRVNQMNSVDLTTNELYNGKPVGATGAPGWIKPGGACQI
jgi:hypothetical protein